MMSIPQGTPQEWPLKKTTQASADQSKRRLTYGKQMHRPTFDEADSGFTGNSPVKGYARPPERLDSKSIAALDSFKASPLQETHLVYAKAERPFKKQRLESDEIKGGLARPTKLSRPTKISKTQADPGSNTPDDCDFDVPDSDEESRQRQRTAPQLRTKPSSLKARLGTTSTFPQPPLTKPTETVVSSHAMDSLLVQERVEARRRADVRAAPAHPPSLSIASTSRKQHKDDKTVKRHGISVPKESVTGSDYSTPLENSSHRGSKSRAGQPPSILRTAGAEIDRRPIEDSSRHVRDNQGRASSTSAHMSDGIQQRNPDVPDPVLHLPPRDGGDDPQGRIHSVRSPTVRSPSQPVVPQKTKLKDRLGFRRSRRISSSPSNASDSGSQTSETSSPSDIQSDAGVVGPGSSALIQAESPPASQMASLATQTPGKSKVTYGGQRSHLVDQSDQADPLLDGPLLDLPDQTSSTRRKLGFVDHGPNDVKVQSGHTSDDEDLEQEKALRSIHELKAAGKMRRTALETDALVDDIFASNSSTLRRSAMFRLASRLLDESFRDAFVRSGLHFRFYDMCALRTDEFFDTAFCMAAGRLLYAIPASDLAPGSAGSGLVDAFVRLVPRDSSLLQNARQRQANMSRIHQRDLKDLLLGYDGEDDANNPGRVRPGDISQRAGRYLGLRCLETAARRLRLAGFRGLLVGMTTLHQVTEIAASQSNRAGSVSEHMREKTLATSILEILSAARISERENGSDLTAELLDKILIILTDHIGVKNDQEWGQANLALRLCLNITTDSQANCEHFIRPAVIELITGVIKTGFEKVGADSGDRDADQLIDILILSLGFLTNLTENADSARLLFLDTRVENATCADCLLMIFRQRLEVASTVTTEWGSKVNVIHGYLAFLICCLCLNAQVRATVAATLQDQTLKRLREAVSQFILFHRTVNSAPMEDERAAENHRQAIFIEHMEAILRKLTLVAG